MCMANVRPALADLMGSAVASPQEKWPAENKGDRAPFYPVG
jgi:hypothetical protein